MKVWMGILALVFASQSHAACTAANFKGTWTMFQSNITAPNPHVGQCSMIVDKLANFTGQCALYGAAEDPANDPSFPVKGSIAVAKDCSAVITQLDPNNAEIARYTIKLATNKLSFAGRAAFTMGPSWGISNGIKQ